MSRRINLTRIHAINWFGYNDVLDVHGNLLIAGVTGSGKSILMDLIQLVLVGDQKSKYNQSATGSASTRTLKSYCLGDTKQDIDGTAQYMRDKGAITYVALEFTWPDRKRVETWGLRLEFDSAAQNQPNHKNGFFIPDRIEKTGWLNEDRTPLEFPAFKRMVRDQAGTVFETMESYRREMGIPTHLNFDRGTLDYLLPAAMSFTFLRSFNEFCRQYILPASEVDIQPVKESFLAFRSLEHELGILRDQMGRLQGIQNSFLAHEAAHRDQQLFLHLEAELRHESALENVRSLRAEVDALEAALAEDNLRLVALEKQIANDDALAKSLHTSLTATEDGKLFFHLRERNRQLVPEIERLKEIGRSIEEAVAARVRQTSQWLQSSSGLAVQLEAADREAVEKAALKLGASGERSLRDKVRHLSSAVMALHRSVETAARPVFAEEASLERERGRLGDLLAALRLGVVPEASVLLNALNHALPRRASENPARALRELCEVTDETWRPALEVAFSRKFAVVVTEEDFDQAESIYHGLKGEAFRESLIHPRHALELTGRAKAGSLAEKLETSHPVAAALVNHLFGDLMCVGKTSELRNHPRAILPDGFQYQRPFVERRAHYKNNPCIGKRGLEKQREYLQEQLHDITVQLQVLSPKIRAVREFLEFAKTHRLDSESVHDDLAEVAQLPDKEKELKDNIAQMARIRDLGLEEKETQMSATESRLNLARRERDQLIGSSRQAQLGVKRRELGDGENKASSAVDRLRRIQLEGPDLSLHRARYQELLADLLSSRPVKDLAADLAKDRFHDCDKETLRLRQELTDLRRELAQAHPGFAEFDPAAEDNAPYDARLARISEGEIPGYEEKARREKTNWQHLFRTQVLAKLHAALFEVENLIAVLNQELRSPIGNNRYQIHRRPNPDREMQTYRDVVDASVSGGEDELFFASMDADIRHAIEEIFQKLIDQPASSEVMAFLDYRNYHDYDMHVTDTRDPDARPSSVDRHSGKFSGGENQSPYFIAILACYLRAYHRYERRRRDPSLAIVPIDEAFSKLSGERIRDCIGALKQLDLQGIFSMSSGNIPYALDMCDQMITVMKREQTVGRRHVIRNVPVSLTREEAMTRYGGGEK
ncbi:MAG: SbcC/MukB-like Walker B domain-containing protein [Terrimicrobiaceae bacterium]